MCFANQPERNNFFSANLKITEIQTDFVKMKYDEIVYQLNMKQKNIFNYN